MPTEKNIVQAVMQNDTYKKFEKIRKNTGRSKSNMASYMIEEYIRNYEELHGPIQLEDGEEE